MEAKIFLPILCLPILLAVQVSGQDIDELRQKSEEGDVKAQYDLGTLYRTGRIVEKGLEKAKIWFKRAAEQNHPYAQLWLQVWDHETLIERLKPIADQEGDAELQYQLAKTYEGIPGVVEPRIGMAATYYKHAANQGHGKAQCALGHAYSVGKGVRQSDVLSYIWYRICDKAEGVNSASSFLVEYNLARAGASFTPALKEAIDDILNLYEEEPIPAWLMEATFLDRSKNR